MEARGRDGEVGARIHDTNINQRTWLASALARKTAEEGAPGFGSFEGAFAATSGLIVNGLGVLVSIPMCRC